MIPIRQCLWLENRIFPFHVSRALMNHGCVVQGYSKYLSLLYKASRAFSLSLVVIIFSCCKLIRISLPVMFLKSRKSCIGVFCCENLALLFSTFRSTFMRLGFLGLQGVLNLSRAPLVALLADSYFYVSNFIRLFSTYNRLALILEPKSKD